MIKTFKKDYLREILYDASNIVQNDVIEVDYKNNVYYELIFKEDEKFWRVTYWENMYERPWEYDEEDIECDQVVPQKVLEDKYVLIEEQPKYINEILAYVLEDDGK